MHILIPDNSTGARQLVGGRRLPPWLRKRLPAGGEMVQTRELLGRLRLGTVCTGARCPNLPDCWSRHTATFMIMGGRCTRSCRFCAVESGNPAPLEADEPERLAEAAAALNLRHVVITSVTRDDLPDEGAGHFARCVGAVRRRLPRATVEVLTPDFHARAECIERVLAAGPTIFNHNIETVRRLTPAIRPQADYDRSLATLRVAKATFSYPFGFEGEGGVRVSPSGGTVEDASPHPHPVACGDHSLPDRETGTTCLTKSGLMVGLGETGEEILATLADLRAAGCDILTVGQYLAPSPAHAPVARFYEPAEFDALADEARRMGFASVAAGPFVRSSYNAAEVYQHAARQPR